MGFIGSPGSKKKETQAFKSSEIDDQVFTFTFKFVVKNLIF